MGAIRVRVDDRGATYVHVEEPEALAEALEAAGLPSPGPVLVIVGGAGKLDAAELGRLTPVFTDGLVPAIERVGAVAVDGGTNAGVMHLLGEAREASSAAFSLVGVAAERLVHLPERLSLRNDAAELEPHHTHFVLVRGDEWGDEASWIASTATCLAGSAPSVTVLVNGGPIAYWDASCSIEDHRPVLVIRGSGRAADEIAAALRGEVADPLARDIAKSALVSYVDGDNPSVVRDAVMAALAVPTR